MRNESPTARRLPTVQAENKGHLRRRISIWGQYQRKRDCPRGKTPRDATRAGERDDHIRA